MKITKKSKLIILIIFCNFFFLLNVYSMPFIGGFYFTDNHFEKNKFFTKHNFSFYIDHKINDYSKFYTRFTGGFKFTGNYYGHNDQLENWTILPNVDLLYLEFKSRYKNMILKLEEDKYHYVNYHLFLVRMGRIMVNQSSGFFFNMKGDGFDAYFTIKNFRLKLFTITNSLDYQSFFNFNEPAAQPVFTMWDTKRYPVYSNFLKENNINGFIGDIESSDYNFFFNTDDFEDYSVSERTRLNKLRYASVLNGRVFPGFSLELNQVYFQNFSLNFLANLDLIPEEFIVTYPSKIFNVYNTFGGKYNSFYISFNANGKIYRGLFYEFEFVYETGTNAAYRDTGEKIFYENTLINSFAIYHKISYYFNTTVKPSVHLYFMYAHGDEDVDFINGAIINQEGQDNNFRSPTSFQIGYVIDPYFSNLIVIGIANTVKPMAGLKNPLFSRFSLESAVLLIMRPVIKGSSFLPEKVVYQKGHTGYEYPEKAFLGAEIDFNILWNVFSDFSFRIESGIFIPNYIIYDDNDVFWKAGFSVNLSF